MPSGPCPGVRESLFLSTTTFYNRMRYNPAARTEQRFFYTVRPFIFVLGYGGFRFAIESHRQRVGIGVPGMNNKALPVALCAVLMGIGALIFFITSKAPSVAAKADDIVAPAPKPASGD